MSRVTSRQSSTCSTIAQGGPRLLGVHTRGASQRSGSSVNSTPCLSRDNSRASGSGSAQQNNIHVQTSFDGSSYGVHSYLGKDSVKARGGGEEGVSYKKSQQPTPTVTVINADSEMTIAGAHGAKQSGLSVSSQPPVQGAFLGARPIISGAPSPRQLSRQGSSIESSTVHTHTVECAGSAHARLHQPVTAHSRGSPTSNECDFHCCSLHTAGHGGSSSHGHHQGQGSSSQGHHHQPNNSHKTSAAATSPVQVRHFLPKSTMLHPDFDQETINFEASLINVILLSKPGQTYANIQCCCCFLG